MGYFNQDSYVTNSTIGQSFGALAWDKIGPLIGGGEYRSLELPAGSQSQQGEDLALSLDRACGIDGLQILPSGICIGLAHRVQRHPDYSTWTIRSERTSGARTELAKRLAAFEVPGALGPYWTVQAYLDPSGALQSVAAIETEILYLVAARELAKGSALVVKEHTNGQDRNRFLSVSWQLEKVQARHPDLALTPRIWRAPARP